MNLFPLLLLFSIVAVPVSCYDFGYVINSNQGSGTCKSQEYIFQEPANIQFYSTCKSFTIGDYRIDTSSDAKVILPNKQKKPILARSYMNADNKVYKKVYWINNHKRCKEYACINDFNFKPGQVIKIDSDDCEYLKVDSTRTMFLSGCLPDVDIYDDPSKYEPKYFGAIMSSEYGFDADRHLFAKLGMDESNAKASGEVKLNITMFDHGDRRYNGIIIITSLQEYFKTEVVVFENGGFPIPLRVVPYYHRFDKYSDRYGIDVQFSPFLLGGKGGYFANKVMKNVSLGMVKQSRCSPILMDVRAVDSAGSNHMYYFNPKLAVNISGMTFISEKRCYKRSVYEFPVNEKMVFGIAVGDEHETYHFAINGQDIILLTAARDNIYGAFRRVQEQDEKVAGKNVLPIAVTSDYIQIGQVVYPHKYYKGRLESVKLEIKHASHLPADFVIEEVNNPDKNICDPPTPPTEPPTAAPTGSTEIPRQPPAKGSANDPGQNIPVVKAGNLDAEDNFDHENIEFEPAGPGGESKTPEIAVPEAVISDSGGKVGAEQKVGEGKVPDDEAAAGIATESGVVQGQERQGEFQTDDEMASFAKPSVSTPSTDKELPNKVPQKAGKKPKSVNKSTGPSSKEFSSTTKPGKPTPKPVFKPKLSKSSPKPVAAAVSSPKPKTAHSTEAAKASVAQVNADSQTSHSNKEVTKPEPVFEKDGSRKNGSGSDGVLPQFEGVGEDEIKSTPPVAKTGPGKHEADDGKFVLGGTTGKSTPGHVAKPTAKVTADGIKLVKLLKHPGTIRTAGRKPAASTAGGGGGGHGSTTKSAEHLNKGKHVEEHVPGFEPDKNGTGKLK